MRETHRTPLDLLASLQQRYPLTTWVFGEAPDGSPVIGFVHRDMFVYDPYVGPGGKPTEPGVAYGIMVSEAEAMRLANEAITAMGLSANAVLCLVDVQSTLETAWRRGLTTANEYCKVMETIASMSVDRLRQAVERNGVSYDADQLRAAVGNSRFEPTGRRLNIMVSGARG